MALVGKPGREALVGFAVQSTNFQTLYREKYPFHPDLTCTPFHTLDLDVSTITSLCPVSTPSPSPALVTTHPRPSPYAHRAHPRAPTQAQAAHPLSACAHTQTPPSTPDTHRHSIALRPSSISSLLHPRPLLFSLAAASKAIHHSPPQKQSRAHRPHPQTTNESQIFANSRRRLRCYPSSDPITSRFPSRDSFVLSLSPTVSLLGAHFSNAPPQPSPGRFQRCFK